MISPLLRVGILLLLLLGNLSGEEPLVATKPVRQIDFRDPVPYGLHPVAYGTGTLTDPVTLLNEQLVQQ